MYLLLSTSYIILLLEKSLEIFCSCVTPIIVILRHRRHLLGKYGAINFTIKMGII